MTLVVSRRFGFASVFAGLLLALTGCGEGSLKWTEDVKLPDGRIVVLRRYQEFYGAAPSPAIARGTAHVQRGPLERSVVENLLRPFQLPADSVA